MKIAIPKETANGETRIACSPETVKKLAALGLDVVVEAGAGAGSSLSDDAFKDAGAAIAPDCGAALGDADIVFKVQRPNDAEVSLMKKGAVLIAMLAPMSNKDAASTYAAHNLTAFAMELVPRISRAQSMDVLSSQSNLAGYKAVLDAAHEYRRAFPMMMTAAGSIAPARVFIMGVGVAGLQAIATARRLGAIVSATDVRAATKEQVESLGAKFVMVESDETEDAETAGGYAKEMSDDYKRAQAELIAETISKQDIVITTALIPGRPAPVLVTEDMVKTMRAGSVINDLAVEAGGNCPISEADTVVVKHGVSLIGYTNVPARLAEDASQLYARNLLNFLTPLINSETGALEINWEDEIITGSALCHDGKVIHPLLTEKGA
ncbi:MAG: Re/Si-specific NAD(P)(+) transhydrogenase subunit alpha [Rhodospirillales bacterium]|jgi:NAD(P) transhydrogenase subunit alpha|nr:Re/Si-specific NAD(P)(+) transhydrogenase subunit alpha [Rhodospirillales bacterium]MBT5076247.1 Re/Si-specific NAD(P)(+) transhydrogenase subunit alpha [Rhodospirillales bacterium]MBT5113743.1 Re/Si-specific NAD(P)(+) transhydrogenase subunit alpha [Rhodospirillales bacterium]MBT5672271.1 Re/Si-specific NAD(P)(+) transhydrogenase subunit alpha [Rhodospirillales bacterium]MBT6187042.1 Re/Si-specific NAD(P)(+) transhydrogenase subunit alpha [Rhodospirillales bacterium]